MILLSIQPICYLLEELIHIARIFEWSYCNNNMHDQWCHHSVYVYEEHNTR